MALDWNGITKMDLRKNATNREAWGRLYDDIEPILSAATQFLRLELDAFSKESGRDRLALWSVRTKKKESFVDKILAIAANSKRHEEKFKKQNCLSVFQLVNDLVGGRQVFYFERDIQEGILFWLGYPAYYPIEVTHWVQDLSGYDTALPAATWLRAIPGITRDPKESGYESLHLILGFVPEVLDARYDVWKSKLGSDVAQGSFDWSSLEKRLADSGLRWEPLSRNLSSVVFEVQCRTVLEHTWAEVDHRGRYASEKAQSKTASLGDHRTFRNYKAILRAAQMAQNSLRTGFNRWDADDHAIVGNPMSIAIGSRAQFWPEKEQRVQLRRVDQKVTSAVATTRRNTSEKSKLKAWDDAVDLFAKVRGALTRDQKCANILVLEPGLSIGEYGQRRVLVLLAGFILANAWIPNRQSQDGEDSSRARAATWFIEANLPIESHKWIPSRVVALRLYEHLRVLDEWYAAIKGERAFLDPLVASRAAEVHFGHFGSFRRASKLLEEALRKLQDWEASDPGSELGLSKAHIGRRLAESYWTAYHLEGREPSDLVRASSAARAALKAAADEMKKGTERHEDLRSKLESHIVTMALYQATDESRNGRLLTGERGWELLRKVRRIAPQEIDARMKKSVRWRKVPSGRRGAAVKSHVSSLQMQGTAIALAVTASEALGKERDALLVEARRIVRAARRKMDDKLASRAGGALQFHLEVLRELEKFVFSLCSDDLGQRDRRRGSSPAR